MKKPVHEETVRNFTAGVRGIITAEEHTIICGLGSIITFILRGTKTPIEVIGIQDCYSQSELNYDDLMSHYGLTENAIIETTRKILAGV